MMNEKETTESIGASIPVLKALGIEVILSSPEKVCIALPIDRNRNDKGTLFAGSSYSALVLSGWLLSMERAKASGFVNPWAAIVDAHVHYVKAIREDIVAQAVFSQTPSLVPGMRNWAEVKVTVGESLAFEGKYAVGERK